MPAEVFTNIVRHLDGASENNLAATCKKMDDWCAPHHAQYVLAGVDLRHAHLQLPRMREVTRREVVADVASLGAHRLVKRAADKEHAPAKRGMYAVLAVPGVLIGTTAGVSVSLASLAAIGWLALPLLAMHEYKAARRISFMSATAPRAFIEQLVDPLLTSEDALITRHTRHVQRRALRDYACESQANLASMPTPLNDNLGKAIEHRVTMFVVETDQKLDLRMRKPHDLTRGNGSL